jgi:hypothetical protein
MQVSWTEDIRPTIELGYAVNDSEGLFVEVRAINTAARQVAATGSQDDYQLGGYAGI